MFIKKEKKNNWFGAAWLIKINRNSIEIRLTIKIKRNYIGIRQTIYLIIGIAQYQLEKSKLYNWKN